MEHGEDLYTDANVDSRLRPDDEARERDDDEARERDDERRRRVATAAYYRAERRGFAPGQEQVDWIEAEMEVEAEDRAHGKLEDNEFPSPK